MQHKELPFIFFKKVLIHYNLLDKKAINKFYLDTQNNVYFIIQNNIFKNNFANENGGCVFISNLNSTGQIILLNNFFISNGISFDIKNNNTLGSIIYLENPSNISIENSNFFNNSGILGTCIYYYESVKDYSLILQKNTFNNNSALIAAGGIFFAQFDENINNDIQKTNKFLNNKASYGEDFSSPPFRMKFNENLNKFGSQNFNHRIIMIPGITTLNFSLSVLDFYNQKIMNLTSGSLCFITLKNFKDYSDIDEIHSTFALDGFSTVNFLNGFTIIK